ncbi:Hypothetical protein Cp106_1534 [Corynebacterium pseudotuberculosis 1/06-A]|nr:Hypothetical protein Cp106_1534 [Corynebacterium pseudotuberculosis 1/06-A]
MAGINPCEGESAKAATRSLKRARRKALIAYMPSGPCITLISSAKKNFLPRPTFLLVVAVPVIVISVPGVNPAIGFRSNTGMGSGNPGTRARNIQPERTSCIAVLTRAVISLPN